MASHVIHGRLGFGMRKSLRPLVSGGDRVAGSFSAECPLDLAGPDGVRCGVCDRPGGASGQTRVGDTI